MAHPPGPKQKRYRGKIRADMVSAKRHIAYLLNWDVGYRLGPADSYPNQLFTEADQNLCNMAYMLLNQWLNAKGPIPDRNAMASEQIAAAAAAAGVKSKRAYRRVQKRALQQSA